MDTAPLPIQVGDDTEPIVLDTTRRWLPKPKPELQWKRPAWADGVVMKRRR